MKTLILLLSFLVFKPQQKEKEQNGCLQLDLMMIVDTSGSLQGYEPFLNRAIKEFSNKFKGTDVRIGLITFDEVTKVQCHLGDSLVYQIKIGGSTFLNQSLEEASVELFGKNSREGYRKMIVIISDGEVYDQDACFKTKNMLKVMGVGVLGVKIRNISNFMNEFCDIVTNSDYESLAEELLKMNLCL